MWLFACAGRDQQRIFEGEEEAAQQWLERVLPCHGTVVVEPLRHRALDFSALYEMADGKAELLGMSTMENDDHGRYQASLVAPKWGSMLYDDVSEFLYREVKVMEWYKEKIPAALAELLPGYTGPLGVDAMVYFGEDMKLQWTPVVELNVRMTMGRVAHELLRKSRPGCTGRLRIVKKDQLSQEDLLVMVESSLNCGSVMLTDPNQAEEFIAVWDIDPPRFNR